MTRSPDSAGRSSNASARRTSRRSQTAPERPEFLASFPDHRALQTAVAAFINGDYRTTRRVCGELLDQDLEAEVHDAARELLRRIAPDRLVIGVLWGSFVLLVLLVLWAYGQQ
jgi:hypothetical protein